jgi:hypothetical protein
MQLLFSQPHLLYIFYFFACLNITYFIGHIVFNAINQKTQSTSYEVFSKLTYGLILLLLIASIFWTKGNTIFLGFLIPIGFLVYKRKVKFNFNLPNFKQFTFLNGIGIPILLLQYLMYSKWGSWTLLPIDINNHAEISYFLTKGFESKYAALNSLEAINVPTKSPYHYVDNWLTTLFYQFLPKTYIGYTMIYVVYPLLFTTLLTGVYSIIKKINLNPIFLIILSTLFLFLGPIDLGFTRKLFDTGHLLSTNTIIFENSGFFFNTLPFSYHGQKHIPFYILACWIVILFSESNEKKALCVIAFAPIINIGVVPSMIGGLGLYTLFQCWKTKKLITPLKNSLPAILSTMFLIFFYKINGGYDIENQTTLNTFSSDLNAKGELLKIAYKITYGFIFIACIYCFYFFFTIKKNERSKQLTLLILFTLLTGLITRILFEGFNTPQFITYILPLVNLYIIYRFSIYFYENSKGKISLLIIISCLCINNLCQTYFHATTRREISIEKIHNQKFISRVNHYLSLNNNLKIGYLLSDSDFKTVPPGFWYGYYPCEYLLTKDYFQFYSLNYPNKTYKENSQKSNNFSPNHLRYILQKKTNYEKYTQEVVTFIKKKKINIILTKNKTTLPKVFYDLIKDSIIDNKSGDKFLILKK